MVSQEVRDFVEQQSIVALGTVSEDGVPNVAPMYWKLWYDDSVILILDNFMRNTKANVLATGKASVAAWNSEAGRAYQLKGTAEYVTEGAYMDAGSRHMESQKPGQRPKGVVAIRITDVYNQQPGEGAGSRVE